MGGTIQSKSFYQIKEVDEDALNQLFEEFYSSLCFFCNRYVSDMDVARSLVQQVFVDLWIKRYKINITDNIKSYLYSSVKNKSVDYLRQQKNKTQITNEVEDSRKIPFKDLVREEEVSNRINKSIEVLPEKCREIFILCRFEGLKYQQTADKLGISIKTVEMQMSIALKRLRKDLSKFGIINYALLFSKKI